MTEDPVKVDRSNLDLLLKVIDDTVSRFADDMTPKGANALLTQTSLYYAVRDACDQKGRLAEALANEEPT